MKEKFNLTPKIQEKLQSILDNENAEYGTNKIINTFLLDVCVAYIKDYEKKNRRKVNSEKEDIEQKALSLVNRKIVENIFGKGGGRNYWRNGYYYPYNNISREGPGSLKVGEKGGWIELRTGKSGDFLDIVLCEEKHLRTRKGAAKCIIEIADAMIKERENE